MIEWHHLFGLGLIDYFTNSCYQVEVEKDLSTKKQRLDVLIIEQGSGQPLVELPDGLENLARRNLLSYKSPRQAFDAWSMDELLGHFVNYRKQCSLRVAGGNFKNLTARRASAKAFARRAQPGRAGTNKQNYSWQNY